MKSRVVIIGAGLGGCFLASKLIKNFDVTIIELTNTTPLLRDSVVDLARPAVTYPHIESGFGGTTKAWHNALMEIDAKVFEKNWPFLKSTLDPYYEQAYLELAGTSRQNIIQFADLLKEKLKNMGFPESLLIQNMFIPKVRINAWNSLKLNGKVKAIIGEVTELVPDSMGAIREIRIQCQNKTIITVESDYFVLSAGGLSSPLLLQKLAKKLPLKCLSHAGFHYEDHPIAFVGELELTKPLYKLWDFPIKIKSGGANIRLPFVIKAKELNISFQLRPAHHLKLSQPRTMLKSTISDLRNFPLKPINYCRLFTQIDDLFEILSFKYGLHMPTKDYSILMVAEQPPSPFCAVWKEINSNKICRRWEIDNEYINTINEAINEFINNLGHLISKSNLFTHWPDNIYSSSHHSGTARISKTQDNGVCDKNGKVHGISNLFVCDGSIIPSSGFVNTGLTIVALAIRMADFISSLKLNNSTSVSNESNL